MSAKAPDFADLKRQPPSGRERFLRLLWKCLPQRGPALDNLLSRKLPELQHLPGRNPQECIPDFESTTVTVRECPMGAWSTPLIDTLVLAKCALGFQSRRILEIGSYLGHTAKLLAENSIAEAKITTLDEYPEHGSAYRGTPLEKKIDRRIGKISLEHFRPEEKYDLIFVDADHRFDSVINDTKVALALVSETGVVVWHDYQHQNHFSGYNDVPEALKLFAATTPILAVNGTWLAMYSRHPGWETEKLLKSDSGKQGGDPWKDRSLRG